MKYNFMKCQHRVKEATRFQKKSLFPRTMIGILGTWMLVKRSIPSGWITETISRKTSGGNVVRSCVTVGTWGWMRIGWGIGFTRTIPGVVVAVVWIGFIKDITVADEETRLKPTLADDICTSELGLIWVIFSESISIQSQ